MRITGIDHAIVTDTDSMQQGGYALVAASSGVTAEERLILNENSGVSDYLHHSGEDRTYFSFFPIGQRHAFVRRFTQGKRRGSQDRIVIHTLLLNAKDLDALDWLPWLIAEATFGYTGSSERFPLTKDAIGVPPDGVLPRLDCEASLDSMGDILKKLQRRVERVRAHFGSERADALIAEVMDALGQRLRVLLPQGAVFEQLALAAWSLLPPLDRRHTAWTQHLGPGMRHISFNIANAPNPQMIADVYGGGAVWRILNPSETSGGAAEYRNMLERQLASAEDRGKFGAETLRWQLGFAHDPDALRRWNNWNASVSGGMGDSELDLQTLSRALRASQRDPWVDDDAVLRFALRHAKRGGELGNTAISRALQDLDQHGIRDILGSLELTLPYIDKLAAGFGELFVLMFLVRASEKTKRERDVLCRTTDALLRRDLPSGSEPFARSLVEKLRAFDHKRREALTARLTKNAETVRQLTSSLAKDKESLPELQNLYGTASDEAGKRAIVRKALDIFSAGGVASTAAWLDILTNDPASYVELLGYSTTDIVLTAFNRIAQSMADPPFAAIATNLVGSEHPGFLKLPAFAELIAAYARHSNRRELWFHQLAQCGRTIDYSNQPHSTDAAAFVRTVARMREDRVALPAAGSMSKVLCGILQNSKAPDDQCVRALVQLGGPSLFSRPELSAAIGSHWQTYPQRAAAWQPLAVEIIAGASAADASKLARDWWYVLPPESVSLAAPMFDALDRITPAGVDSVVKRWRPFLPRVAADRTGDEFVVRLRRIAVKAGLNANDLWLDALWREFELRGGSLAAIVMAADDSSDRERLCSFNSTFNTRFRERFRSEVERLRQLLSILATPLALTPSARRWAIDQASNEIRRLNVDQWRELQSSKLIEPLLREWRLAKAAAESIARFKQQDVVQAFVDAATKARAFDVLAVLAHSSKHSKTKKSVSHKRSEHGAFLWIGEHR